jgi:hypothetical protein
MDTVHLEVQLFSKAAERAKHVEENYSQSLISKPWTKYSCFCEQGQNRNSRVKTADWGRFSVIFDFGQYLQSLISFWYSKSNSHIYIIYATC